MQTSAKHVDHSAELKMLNYESFLVQRRERASDSLTFLLIKKFHLDSWRTLWETNSFIIDGYRNDSHRSRKGTEAWLSSTGTGTRRRFVCAAGSRLNWLELNALEFSWLNTPNSLLPELKKTNWYGLPEFVEEIGRGTSKRVQKKSPRQTRSLKFCVTIGDSWRSTRQRQQHAVES